MFEFFSSLLKSYPDWVLLLTLFVSALWTVRSLVLSLFQTFIGSIGALVGIVFLVLTVAVYIQVGASVPAGYDIWAIGLSLAGGLLGLMSALRRFYLEKQTQALGNTLQSVAMIVSPDNHMSNDQRIEILRQIFGFEAPGAVTEMPVIMRPPTSEVSTGDGEVTGVTGE